MKLREGEIKEADRVTISPTERSIRIKGGGEKIKQELLGRPVSKGDLITPTGFQKKMQWGPDSIVSQFFGDMLQEDSDLSSFSIDEIHFMVTEINPTNGIVLITKDTEVKISSERAEDLPEKESLMISTEEFKKIRKEFVQTIEESLQQAERKLEKRGAKVKYSDYDPQTIIVKDPDVKIIRENSSEEGEN